MERRNNYDRAARDAEKRFLSYDQETLIRAFGLKADAEFLYVRFVARDYRINRETGAVESLPDRRRAGFEEVLSIFDALCYSGRPPVLTGDWTPTGSLHRAASGPSSMDNPRLAAAFAENAARLPAVCQTLDASIAEGGDFCCEIPVFEPFRTRLRLWLPDDEFPAQLQFFWDRNALSFVHYETIFYMMNHILSRFEALLS